MISLLRCLIQREKWKRAQRVYREEMERIPRLPYVGALHRALLLKSGAWLAWKLHDLTAWKTRVKEAYDLMADAGLNHQLRSLRRIYGQELDTQVGLPG